MNKISTAAATAAAAAAFALAGTAVASAELNGTTTVCVAGDSISIHESLPSLGDGQGSLTGAVACGDEIVSGDAEATGEFLGTEGSAKAAGGATPDSLSGSGQMEGATPGAAGETKGEGALTPTDGLSADGKTVLTEPVDFSLSGEAGVPGS
ncbi:hypothetical protein [Nocardia transvalensis]|uniref:hypothetical protein n=1 Tax=Nocardia transvalensis TaxID=37333 RepID=UPI00189405CA|nr:hypothetical protein [Nocardia transvalensis]MBF6331968.1 hypothetical protein [Nocardia transvalensis]